MEYWLQTVVIEIHDCRYQRYQKNLNFKNSKPIISSWISNLNPLKNLDHWDARIVYGQQNYIYQNQ